MKTSWDKLLFIPLMLSIALILGFHVAAIAILMRQWTRVPYLLWMVLLYTLLVAPLFWIAPAISVIYPIAATCCVFASLLLANCFWGWEQVLDGDLIETAAPPHGLLIFSYALLLFVEFMVKKFEQLPS